MRSTFGLLIVLSLVVSVGNSFSADESHQEKKESTSTRPNAPEKKPTTLAEKLSACLTERPSGDKKEASGEAEEKLGKTYSSQGSADAAAKTGPSGAELFQANCASCHAPNASQGPIVDWALAAQRAGTDMPPNGKKFTADELSKLRAFFATKK